MSVDPSRSWALIYYGTKAEITNKKYKQAKRDGPCIQLIILVPVVSLDNPMFLQIHKSIPTQRYPYITDIQSYNKLSQNTLHKVGPLCFLKPKMQIPTSAHSPSAKCHPARQEIDPRIGDSLLPVFT